MVENSKADKRYRKGVKQEKETRATEARKAGSREEKGNKSEREKT